MRITNFYLLVMVLSVILLVAGCVEEGVTESKVITIKDHAILDKGDYVQYVVSDENENVYIVISPSSSSYTSNKAFLLWYSLLEGAQYRIDRLPGYGSNNPFYSFTLVDGTNGRHITLDEVNDRDLITYNTANIGTGGGS